MADARVPLIEDGPVMDRLDEVLAEGNLGSIPTQLNIFAALANSPVAMAALGEYQSSLYGELTDRERELVILAVARELSVEYEWHQHVESARTVGIPTADIEAIGAENLDEFADDERALIEYAMAVVGGDVSKQEFEALSAHYGDEKLTVITLLAGAYHMVADFLVALDIPIEAEFVGWTDIE